MKQTNLDKIKEMSKLLFLAVPIKATKIPFIIQHPFTSNNLYVSVKENQDNPKILDLYKKEDYEIFKSETFEKIDNAKDLFGIVMLLNKSYYLTFFKYVNIYLSNEDFSKLLSEFYVMEEWPNQDNNVNRRELIKYFKKANKDFLMDKKELDSFNTLKRLASLPSGVIVYRGVSHNGKPEGLSWTVDKEKARWFAERFSKAGNNTNPKLYKMVITNPDAILACYEARNESEVIVDTTICHNWICENL